jgi:hypothetical protein
MQPGWTQTEEVGLVMLPMDDQTSEVMQPGKQPFAFSATAVASKLASVLGFVTDAIGFVECD